jgi:putative endonuclease
MAARLVLHNQKRNGFTGSVNDWVLVYKEEYKVKEKAFFREREIKNWKSRKMIVRLISEE